MGSRAQSNHAATSIASDNSSIYPLKSLKPSSSIPRLPLLKFGTEDCVKFAERSRDGKILESHKKFFSESRVVAALSIPAQNATAFQQSSQLKASVLRLPKIKSLLADPSDKARRLLLLNVDRLDHLSAQGQDLVRMESLPVTQSVIEVDWDYWNVDEVLASLLPEGLPEGTPTAFASTGHIAHLNLREEYHAYRYIIGQVILEKNNQIRTVVNKLDSIDNVFRFFKMERLAGDDDYEVTVSESNCTFTFDFRNVYWNSRLQNEHERLISTFKPFEVVSDVMAGVGPFAVPAAKRGAYVLANDLNPASYKSMVSNAKKNKVENRLRCYCEDGRNFIRESVKRCWNEPFDGIPVTEEGRKLELASQTSRAKGKQQHLAYKGSTQDQPVKRGRSRRLIDHFVMNLPDSALQFLDAFPGAYNSLPREEVEAELEREDTKYPLVHVHCFTKDLEHPHEDICQRASERLGLGGPAHLVPAVIKSANGKEAKAKSAENGISQGLDSLNLGQKDLPDLHLQYVRSVAPNKDMYCLSFRLTPEILFRDV